ncbi:MAG: 1-acyl-sn-glycerol-3-phosphate acyltransferase [Desulfobacterium sp.]|nr:1-acyl-sn-glycerol-3-phosphate acyltransferase [Desulfobacterium sp.]MBU3947485.1 1-acyl-sn-glycerol-3-phosphate acyltransferase [Pseudomonadota bacterium]MBU4011016.1 1-acyl-sn-glycerol-3-phosphate acyltransferase [Pseudomonadota bacterium]
MGSKTGITGRINALNTLTGVICFNLIRPFRYLVVVCMIGAGIRKNKFKKLLHIFGRAFISFLLGVENASKIKDGQFIIAANHNSHIDVMVLFRLVDISRVNQVKTIVAKDYFDKGLKGYIAKILFNSVLVDRSTSAIKTFKILKKELEDGYSLIIFPEGTRGQPGIINEFKSGIGQISLDFPNIPIYPVYLSGAEKSLPKGTRIPVPFNIKISVL